MVLNSSGDVTRPTPMRAELARIAGRWRATWPSQADRVPWIDEIAAPDESLRAGWFQRLCGALDLSPFERDLVVVACMPELDERMSDLFQELHAPFAMRRPTLGTATRLLLGMDADRQIVREHLALSCLWSHGVLVPPDDDRVAFFDRELRPVRAFLEILEGRSAVRFSCGAVLTNRTEAESRGAQRELEARRPLADLARHEALWLRGGTGRFVLVRSVDVERARVVAGGIATELDLPVLWLRQARSAASLWLARAAAEFQGALLVVEPVPGGAASGAGGDRPTAARLSLPDGWIPDGGAIAVGDPRVEIHDLTEEPVRTVEAQLPRPSEQAMLWTAELSRAGIGADVRRLAARTRLSTAEIRRAIVVARGLADTRGEESVTQQDLGRALIENGPGLHSPLADVRPPRDRWKQLVLERRPKALLDDLVQRVELRAVVQDEWQMRDVSGRGDGLVALLHGDSGTGKTLAAEAVAGRLDLPLLHVDLSRVVSKYIGETEQRLAELFDLVEGYRAVLFFDEADALFGKRTSVRDSHDRYANIEVNFLLQRLELLEGVAILATNLLSNMDEAFTRRLQFVVHMPRPSAGLQKRIWEQHVPQDRLADGVDFDSVTARHDLVGGEVRNAALTAAYAAAADGGEIRAEHLENAVRQELLKKGRSVTS